MWSAQVFAPRPSAGLAAVLVMNALGLLAGAPVFGAIADHTGLATVFDLSAVLLLCTAALAPREQVAETEERAMWSRLSAAGGRCRTARAATSPSPLSADVRSREQ